GTSASMMAVSFANSGLFSLGQMILFLLGSNLGTVFTVWLFALKTGPWAIYLLGAGVLPMIHARRDSLSSLGKALFALGLLLLAYQVMLSGLQQPHWTTMELLPSSLGGLEYWGVIGI